MSVTFSKINIYFLKVHKRKKQKERKKKRGPITVMALPPSLDGGVHPWGGT